MNSDTLPTASSPCPTDNVEVLSQWALSRWEIVPEAPQGDLPDSRSKGSKAPGGSKLGSQPNTAPEPPVVPDLSRWPHFKRDKTLVLATSVHPEAPNNLLGALRGASIDEEHCTIMSAVIKKVQSAKSALTEACASLLTGSEVSIENIGKILLHR